MGYTDKWQGMNWLRQDLRLAIYLRDGLACAYCGASVETGTQLTLDHVRCRVNGGSNKPSNLITCCHGCNCRRNTRSVEEFTAAVADYVNHGISGQDILGYVKAQLKKSVKPFRVQAKALIAQRGSAAKVIAAHEGQS